MDGKSRTNGERLLPHREYAMHTMQLLNGQPSINKDFWGDEHPCWSTHLEAYDHKDDDDGNKEEEDLVELYVEKYPSPSDCVDCKVCDLQFESMDRQQKDSIVYSRHVGESEAQSLILDLLRSIETTRLYLGDRIKSEGDCLLARWQQLDQRKLSVRLKKFGVESKAWPQVERYMEYDLGWHEKRQYRNAFLVPYLNVEAIATSSSRFLRLLHYRTSHPSADYFWNDLMRLEFPIMSGLLEKTFNARCMETSGKRRGILIPWDRERVHRRNICGFPVAHLVLQAQQLLMRTMRDIVDETLREPKTEEAATLGIEQ